MRKDTLVSILLISEIFPPKTGGSGRWFWEIYRRLARKDVVIAAGTDPRQDSFDLTHDLRVTRVPLTLKSWGISSAAGLRDYWRAHRQVRRIVKEQSVHYVHCGRVLPEGWLAWLLNRTRNLPYVCYVHGEEMNYAASSRELSWMMRRVLRRASHVVANSRNTQRLLEVDWNVPASRVQLLHPGVDTERFVPADWDLQHRTQLGWFDRPVVLTVGRLQKRKGHDQMIRALPLVRQAVPNVLYAIVGDGEERPLLQDLVSREGVKEHVQFLGEICDEDLMRCYQQCDLFILPNRQVGQDIEGFGMVLLEAQASGKPVIAGDSGGTSETMRIPETGVVIHCETPGPIARTVIELIRDADRRACMGRAGRSWVVENFDWTALSHQAASLFNVRRHEPQPCGVPAAVSP